MTTASPTVEERRKSEERRTGGERRRGGDGRRVVIHLSRTELHVALTVRDAHGEAEVLHVTSVCWAEPDTRLPSQQAFEALASTLKQVVSKERLSGAATSMVLGSDLCVTRVAAGPTAEVRTALDEIDDRCQMYLSLGAGPKTIAISRQNLDARHERAVVSVARQETVEQLLQVVENAGLELVHVEAEAIAAARVHGALHPGDEKPVMIVQFDGDGFDIAVSHRGVLLLDYRPGAGAPGAKVTSVLRQHHARLQRFCQRQLMDFKLKLDTVYLTGQVDRVEAAAAEFNAGSDYRASVLDTESARTAWNRAPDRLGPEHALLLGRAMREIDAAPDTPAPNLIERWIAESRKHIRPILLRAAAPLVAVMLLAAGMAGYNHYVGGKTAVLQAQLDELRPAKLEHDRLRLRLVADSDKLKRLERLAESVPQADLISVISQVSGCLPDDVWLDRFSLGDEDQVRVAGFSYSESGVYDVVRYLDQAPRFSQVALEGTGLASTRQGPATSFEVKLVLAEKAGASPNQATP
ncbi:MAG: PilN domain-containing protein [Planctomycetota bacterium]